MLTSYLISIIFSLCWWIVLIYTMALELTEEMGDRVKYLTSHRLPTRLIVLGIFSVIIPVINILIALIGLSEYETIYYKSRQIILEQIEINELKGEVDGKR